MQERNRLEAFQYETVCNIALTINVPFKQIKTTPQSVPQWGIPHQSGTDRTLSTQWLKRVNKNNRHISRQPFQIHICGDAPKWPHTEHLTIHHDLSTLASKPYMNKMFHFCTSLAYPFTMYNYSKNAQQHNHPKNLTITIDKELMQ